MIEVLNISNQHLTSLPDTLSQSLQELYCHTNQLISLPDNLPQSLQTLYCQYNQLTSLPDNLPQSLQTLGCYCNKLTSLPEILPQSLQKLDCYINQLTKLSDILPQSLQRLDCTNNQLTSLPDNLPQNLQRLYCSNNQLTILPDLPILIQYINIKNNPLEQNYPGIFTYQSAKEIINYVNKCNGIRRTKQWLSIVNANNVFLERYMQRAMHPSRLKTLKDNTDIDVDEFMTRYVEAL